VLVCNDTRPPLNGSVALTAAISINPGLLFPLIITHTLLKTWHTAHVKCKQTNQYTFIIRLSTLKCNIVLFLC